MAYFLPKISEKFTEKKPNVQGGGVKPVGPNSQLLPKICFWGFPISMKGNKAFAIEWKIGNRKGNQGQCEALVKSDTFHSLEHPMCAKK